MTSSASFLRQLSGKQGWKSKPCRWGVNNNNNNKNNNSKDNNKNSNGVEEGGDDDGLVIRKKRVMVVVDQSSHAKHAMMWALTHVATKGDLLTLLHVIPPITNSSFHSFSSSSSSSSLANSLRSICKACKPEVEVETVVIQGPKLSTVTSQVKKLGVSVLVLGQKRQSPLLTWCLCGRSENEVFVEQCIKNIHRRCLTVGVRKQSKGVSGYLITTRWLNNFWLLA